MSEGGLRRRGAGGATTQAEVPRAFDAIRKIDFYAKVKEDCVQKSQVGGTVTVVVVLFLIVLFWHELRAFWTADFDDQFTVDTRLDQRMQFGLDISFPSLRCVQGSVDCVDSGGGSQLNIEDTLLKLPLDAKGKEIQQQAPQPDECQSCLKASGGAQRCCNTCEELKQAYAAQGLQYMDTLKTAPQCKDAVGCRIRGTFDTVKLSGNVHIALGGSTVRGGKEAPSFGAEELEEGFNTSHQINAITFGQEIPGFESPLDGTAKIVKHGVYLFSYRIKLVPTIFTDFSGNHRYTHQYSVNHNSGGMMVRGGHLMGLPGVFFNYDFSPFMILRQERYKRVSAFVTSICAIVGGAFSLASIVEMFLRNWQSVFKA